TIGTGWEANLDRLRELEPHVEDAGFRADFAAAKRANKVELSNWIGRQLGVQVSPDAVFDVQVKRIHEYKRQLLNLLHVITLYNRIRAHPEGDFLPRTVIFGGKAAPGYRMAKQIIRLINDVADVVNHDPLVAGRLRVVFIPNYDVSTAQDIIPAADLSEQISTAGTEASGTGNMKLALNGALTIGTLDGANIEIRNEVGAENIFIFGLTTEGVAAVRAAGHDPWRHYRENAELAQVLDMIRDGFFSPEEPTRHRCIFDALTAGGDPFLLLADYADYVACQQEVERVYRDRDEWLRRAVLNVARMGRFSADRTIREYAEVIWNVKPVRLRRQVRR
ncbi:MAG: glycogen/starch/alpha-glucan phosphorylase, partial [Burkholderiales bacterium]